MSIAPTLLVAAMAVQISGTLGLGSGALGLAVSGFFGATAATTAVLGRVVARYGARAGMAAVMAVNCTVLVFLAVSQSIWMVVAGLIVGGVANGAIHPASNLVLADGVRGHLGLALGIKQSSMPAAALAGGLAVPAIALTVGWRWAFVSAAVASLALVVAALRYRAPVHDPQPRDQPEPAEIPTAPPLRLKLLSVAVCCAAAAGTSLNVFLVDGGVQSAALAPASAGMLAACCGGLAVAGRTGLGWFADRRPASNPMYATLILIVTCSVGGALMAAGPQTVFVIGALLAAGVGFGWTGLVHLSAMRANADTARATGTLMTGFAGGSCVGPLLMGQVSTHFGYPAVWVCVSALSLIGAALIVLVTRQRPSSACAAAIPKGASR